MSPPQSMATHGLASCRRVATWRATAAVAAVVAAASLALHAPTVAAAGHERCAFRCKGGGEPTPKPGYVTHSNGCGPEGLKFDAGFGLEACCDAHDKCYGTCGAKYETCEKEFSACMAGVCGGLKKKADKEACEGTKRMMEMGTGLLGCGSFEASQRDACVCPNEEAVDEPMAVGGLDEVVRSRKGGAGVDRPHGTSRGRGAAAAAGAGADAGNVFGDLLGDLKAGFAKGMKDGVPSADAFGAKGKRASKGKGKGRGKATKVGGKKRRTGSGGGGAAGTGGASPIDSAETDALKARIADLQRRSDELGIGGGDLEL